MQTEGGWNRLSTKMPPSALRAERRRRNHFSLKRLSRGLGSSIVGYQRHPLGLRESCGDRSTTLRGPAPEGHKLLILSSL